MDEIYRQMSTFQSNLYLKLSKLHMLDEYTELRGRYI